MLVIASFFCALNGGFIVKRVLKHFIKLLAAIHFDLPIKNRGHSL